MEIAIQNPNRVSGPEDDSPHRIEGKQYQKGMITGFGKTNLVAEIDEVRSETELSDSAERDEQKKIRMISRLEGGHRGGGRKSEVLSYVAGMKSL